MLGEKISELQAKVTSMRVLPSMGGGPLVETSFAGKGKLLGIETNEMGSYTAEMRPSGVLHGIGQGIVMSSEGDGLTWKGSGIGRPTGKGMAASFRYSLVVETTSAKWARLNGVLLVGEWDVDENGNGVGANWEWR